MVDIIKKSSKLVFSGDEIPRVSNYLSKYGWSPNLINFSENHADLTSKIFTNMIFFQTKYVSF